MFFGRFFMLIPILGIAGSLAAKKKVPASAGTFPVTGPLFTLLLDRRDRDRRRADVLPRLLARPHRGAPPDEGRDALLRRTRRDRNAATRKLFDRAIVRARDPRLLPEARPAPSGEEPGHVRRARRARSSSPSCSSATSPRAKDVLFDLQIALWLWFTLLFANFAEAMAEGRGKAQAETLAARADRDDRPRRLTKKGEEAVPATALRKGDRVVVEAGQVIPGDGTVVEGIASVDESAITGESAPVIRESGGDRSAVTGGTRVLSDRIVVEITSNPGETFIDRMIALVEGASRQKTPNEIALSILLAGPDDRLPDRDRHAAALRDLRGRRGHDGRPDRAPRLPDPDDDRRAPLGDRHRRHGPRPPAQRPRDVGPRRRGGGRRQRAAPRQDRHDHARQPPGDGFLPGARRPARATSPKPRSSPRSRTRRPEGRSIVVLAKEKFGLRGRRVEGMTFIPFSASTRMSGVDFNGRQIRKGAGDSVAEWVRSQGGDDRSGRQRPRQPDRRPRERRRFSSPTAPGCSA